MADANLIIAIARGLRPAQISGAVANARSEVNQLIASGQVSDSQAIASLMAANVIKSPNNIDLIV